MPPIPVSNEILAQNISTTLRDIYTLLEAAENLRTRAKTVYYKAVVLLAASVLEAMVYHYIDCLCKQDPSLLVKAGKKKLRRLIALNSKVLETEKKLWVAEDVVQPLKLSDVLINSKDMNHFLLDNDFIDRQTFSKLEYSREKRNQIHLQTLDSTHRSYTATMVDRIGDAIDIIYGKLELLNPTLSIQSELQLQ